MNWRNRKLVITMRTVFGLFMVFSGVSGFLMGPNPEGVAEPMLGYTKVLWETGLFHMIKITETVAGAMLLLGFLPALATLFLAPLAVGILVFNAVVSPAFLPMGLIVCAFTGYLGYAYWAQYKAIFH